MASNRSIEYHQQWIGYLNPTGLVFSPHAIDDAQAVINEGVVSEQKEFLALVTKSVNDSIEYTGLENIRDLFFKILNWREADLNSDQAIITQYSFSHPQFNEVVSPTYISKINDEKVILIQELDLDDFDKVSNTEDAWNSSPHFKFERLLREKQVSAGLIVSKYKLRLIFAPRGESSGYVDFPYKEMYKPSGRLVFAAFRELLSDAKVFNSPKGQSLIEILELSRKYQAKVSIELSGQVLAALYELLRGFQTANDDESGKLLEKNLKENPQLIYEGLLTTLLRMVFIMYAEDRNLLATDEVYQSSYSLAGLYERLRQDEAQSPDTMDSRYGAWAHLISLFRLIYDGAEYESEKGKVVLPARHGHLFDPSIYLFLEGRDSKEQSYNKAPKISDGVVFRVLKNLLVLENKETKTGERISYRTLDVEQIGSVYETMMGFELGIADGETIALKPAKSHGAPLPINLDKILATKDKAKKLGEVSELKLSDKVKKEFNECKTIEALESVLDKRIDRRATPFRLSKGAMVLVPSEARRKSGSHYTPRELTEPIVRVALEPILKNLGETPTPEQILDLKICDPAMGSGAFLVESCRQLSEKLVEAWATHKIKIQISADEDELLYARKLIAQKCLYGVDKNHMAVNLAKLSLWLVTLAKDHSFGFLDHNLKHGDSLLGLNNKQIMAFDYTDRTEGLPLFQYMKDQLTEALDARDEIRNASEENNYDALKLAEDEYQERLEPLRLVGNLALKCFFDGENEKSRIANLQKHSLVISNYFSSNALDKLEEYCKTQLKNDFKYIPFHWELEFPEVFAKHYKGFDGFIGNPPFLGGRKISTAFGIPYFKFLINKFVGAANTCDLVAYFFRNAFVLLNSKGTMCLISTNTISQGDTRVGGLKHIVQEFGKIFFVDTRIRWPGEAAVVVSVVGVSKHQGNKIPCILNGKPVSVISSYFVPSDFNDEPLRLENNPYYSLGSYIYGAGFIFDDNDPDASPLSLMDTIKNRKDSQSDRIFPYIGGEETNSSPTHAYSRFVIYLSDLDDPKNMEQFPDLLEIVSEKVKPLRESLGNNPVNEPLKRRWWCYQAHRPELYERLSKINECFVLSRVSPNLSIAKVSSKIIFSDSLVVFATDKMSFFAITQSSIHEIWARFFSSSMKDDLRYSASDCFETFPFPDEYAENDELNLAGSEYLKFRSDLMIELNEGLTKIYNRYHNPEDVSAGIVKLRELHAKLNNAVLKSYGWTDISIKYDYLLDFEEDDQETTGTSRRRKPYRLKFTPEISDEILGRLLSLNKLQKDKELLNEADKG